MQNGKFKYRVLVKSLDPTKYGKALSDKLFVEVSESKDKSQIFITSDQNAVFLKRKFGIVSDSDIVQIEDSTEDSEVKDYQTVQVVTKASELESTKVEPRNQSESETEIESGQGFKNVKTL